jgi:hypothetical protein
LRLINFLENSIFFRIVQALWETQNKTFAVQDEKYFQSEFDSASLLLDSVVKFMH